MQSHLGNRLHEVAIHRECLKAFEHGHQHQQMAVDDNEQQRRNLHHEARHGAELGVAGGVKERGKVQPHLQTNHLTGYFDRRHDQTHGKADGQAHHNLLHQRAQRLRRGNADHDLIAQYGLRAQGNQKGKAHLEPHGNGALRKHGRGGEQGQHAHKRPDQRR